MGWWVDGKWWATAGLVPGYHRGHGGHGGGWEKGFLVFREPSGIDRAKRWKALATTEGAGQPKPRGKRPAEDSLPFPLCSRCPLW